ncbi:hypothetical protein L1049_017138 [Liquidambar formosana]|uniref:Cupin type-1 domain-containing protein n=1 Tax=Liquidambar formosana TaxID=63359 RepID=A0AAP0S0L6_LIQFO
MVIKTTKLSLFLLILALFLASVSLSFAGEWNPQDPREEYRECEQRCQQGQRGQQQQQCERRCEKQFREREREERERDPREQYEQCQQRCQRQERGQPQQQQQCERRCEKQFEEQQREQEERERERGRGSGNPQDPREEYRECEQRCQQEQRGQQQQQCERRCEKQFREREREERERDPREQHEQCQQRCERQERGQPQRQQQCERRCEKQFEEQQREQEERERERGRGSGNPQDPREQYERCQQQCRRQQGRQQEQCQRRCVEEFEERQREHDGEGGMGRFQQDPEQEYQQCQRRCEQQEQREGQGQQRECQQRCEQQYRERQREQGRGRGEGNTQRESREQMQQGDNPYFFHEQRFKSQFRTQEGHIRVLERFSKRSELLRGIENYRLAIFEANPNTFVMPHHCDAESVLAVLRGRGNIAFVRQERREYFNLEVGDVIRIPAGTTVYMINRENSERLQIAKLMQPVFNPGQYKEYFGAAGENPRTFYRAFSNELLEAALRTPREKLDRLFGQQRKGAIIKATQEQIKALSQHASSGRHRWQRGEYRGPFNVLNERPLFSNNFGQLHEASPDEYRQLQDMDVSVSFININQGGMMAPNYNSRATKLVFVAEGSGRFEMACPHLSSQRGAQGWRGQGQEREQEQEEGQEQEQEGVQYQQVSSHLSPGDVFIIPAGHPVAVVANRNENLRLISFGVNAQNNERHFLAGQENIMNQLDREAKELSFNMPARDVEEVFKNQRDSYFVAGPEMGQQQREEGRGRGFVSLLGLLGY